MNHIKVYRLGTPRVPTECLDAPISVKKFIRKSKLFYACSTAAQAELWWTGAYDWFKEQDLYEVITTQEHQAYIFDGENLYEIDNSDINSFEDKDIEKAQLLISMDDIIKVEMYKEHPPAYW